ncbi:MAG: sigma-70 family RNA polymerase sigma factor, partial [Coriobacteriia bacterium]|nr:sigma-70 family RNA polymerase sigma factor [Coriobacteriia bacterium]
WIQVIARNLCNMQLRRKNLAMLLDAEQEIDNIDAEESDELLPAIYAERADLKERLGRIIDTLSDVQRQAIVLYYFNELSVEEIANVMECSPNTVKTRLFLARKAIRSEVEEQERKSGERFYGIAGIAMLPLGDLIHTHLSTLAISPHLASNTLSAITKAIASTASEASPQTPGTPIHVDKTSALQARIMAGTAAVASVGAVAVLAVILVTGSASAPQVGDGQNTGSGFPAVSGQSRNVVGDAQTRALGAIAALPEPEALDALFGVLEGYWVSDSEFFVGFVHLQGEPAIVYGLFQTEFGRSGRIVDRYATGRYEAVLVIGIADDLEPSSSDEAPTERTEAVYIDVSDLIHSGEIQVRVDAISNGEWQTFEYGSLDFWDAFSIWYDKER